MKTVATIALAAAISAATIAGSTGVAEAKHNDAAIALGIAGLVIGGIAASRYHQGYYPYYGRYYDPYPGPYYRGHSGRVAWCIAHYRSYNPYTRRYLGFDRRWHYC